MRCRECSYDLTGLCAGNCPECGCRFNPENPATFATETAAARGPVVWWIVGLAGAPILLSVLVHLAPLVYAIQFGRFPTIVSGDDPRSMALHGPLSLVTAIASAATILGLLGAFVAISFVLSTNLRRGAVTFLLFFLLWLAPVWLLSADPFDAVAWWHG